MTTGVPEKLCAVDGVPTRISCARCDTPICPSCYHAGPVGMVCTACTAPSSSPTAASRPAWLVPAAIIGVVVLVLAASAVLGTSGSREAGDTSLAADLTPELHVGDEFVAHGVTYSVTDFRCTGGEIDVAGGQRVALGQWCLADYTVSNGSQRPYHFVAFAQELVDDDRRLHGIDPMATANHPSNWGRDPLVTALNPGNLLTTTVAFDIPVDARPLELLVGTGPDGPPRRVLLTPSPAD